jgi:hypothetical protein
MLKVICPVTGETFFLEPVHRDHWSLLQMHSVDWMMPFREVRKMVSHFQDKMGKEWRGLYWQRQKLNRRAILNNNALEAAPLPLADLWRIWRQSMEGLRLGIELGIADADTIADYQRGLAWGELIREKARQLMRERYSAEEIEEAETLRRWPWHR